MSRELKIHATCSAPGCGKEWIVEPGDNPITITIDGETHELDLCAKSKAEFKQMWLAEARPATVHKLTPKTTKAKKGKVARIPRDRFPCLVADCEVTPNAKTTLRSHMNNKHGLSWEKISEMMYEAGYLDRAPMPREKCPECKDSYAVSNLPRHRRDSHGVGE